MSFSVDSERQNGCTWAGFATSFIFKQLQHESELHSVTSGGAYGIFLSRIWGRGGGGDFLFQFYFYIIRSSEGSDAIMLNGNGIESKSSLLSIQVALEALMDKAAVTSIQDLVELDPNQVPDRSCNVHCFKYRNITLTDCGNRL